MGVLSAAAENRRLVKKRTVVKLKASDYVGLPKNVAIAKALQLQAARRRAVPIRFNFVARAKFKLAQPICCRLRAFLLLIRYVTLVP